MDRKILYIQCNSGVSGDMILGAMVDLGLEVETLKAELQKLQLTGYRIAAEKTSGYGIAGTRCHVILEDEAHHHENQDHCHHEDDHKDHDHGHHGDDHQAHDHCHGVYDHEHPLFAGEAKAQGEIPDYKQAQAHHHHHRSYKDIKAIIDQSTLEAPVKATALAIFDRVARAEAKVHQTTVDAVHFHEVGAVDSIVDIVGAAIGFHLLKADQIYVSPINLGQGFVKCAHGILPVPAPATAEILADSQLLSYARHIDGEAATPTGVAILAELASPVAQVPPMVTDQVAYGFGGRDFGMLNALRMVSGHADCGDDGVMVLETNMDDITGEAAGYLLECLLDAGALDVFYTPNYMNKKRPGIRLTLLARDGDVSAMERLILRESTTIGLRKYRAERICMKRQFRAVQTKFGPITLKVCDYGDIHKETPEYEDVRAAAKAAGVSFLEVLAAVEKER